MSIHLPDYSLPPPVLLPRSRRVRAIVWNEIRTRMRAINVVVLVLIFVIVDFPLVLEFYLVGLTGGLLAGAVPPLARFDEPFAIGAWSFFITLLVSSVGAAIVAGDVATKSITMYLSRPITHADYLGAKVGAAGFWVALGAILPGVVGTVVVLALGYVSLTVAVEAIGGFVVVGLLTVVALTGLGVFLSSVSSKSAYAAAGIFGTLIGAQAIASVLNAVSGRASFLYLSPLDDVNGAAGAVFGVRGNPLDPWACGAILLGIGVATLVLAYLRLRKAEVVAE